MGKKADFFSDKVAIITGAASGIGRTVSFEMAKKGAVIIAADKNLEGVNETAPYIKKNGGRAHARYLDVTKPDEVEGLVKKTVAEQGRIDYMFNNAGIGVAGEVRDMDIRHWRETVDVNLWGVIYGTLTAYRVMIDQGFGHIVNTASLAGLVPIPITTAYTMTKHGVVGLSVALRAEASNLGVKVSVVCPGVINTDILYSGLVLKAERKEALDNLKLKPMNVAKAARSILKSVRKNRSIIKVTLHARIFWWLFRISPALFYPICLQSVKDFRKIRKE